MYFNNRSQAGIQRGYNKGAQWYLVIHAGNHISQAVVSRQ